MILGFSNSDRRSFLGVSVCSNKSGCRQQEWTMVAFWSLYESKCAANYEVLRSRLDLDPIVATSLFGQDLNLESQQLHLQHRTTTSYLTPSDNTLILQHVSLIKSVAVNSFLVFLTHLSKPDDFTDDRSREASRPRRPPRPPSRQRTSP